MRVRGIWESRIAFPRPKHSLRFSFISDVDVRLAGASRHRERRSICPEGGMVQWEGDMMGGKQRIEQRQNLERCNSDAGEGTESRE